ncbi:arp2/3 complex-activating protein rickA isoform X3 [Linepithema humile]|uniref:arp2/3 complex-activating protein rickA isoform X3 n=1 Tax=Linepithema humile TaxID=83485 RepID=UPI00351DFA30
MRFSYFSLALAIIFVIAITYAPTTEAAPKHKEHNSNKKENCHGDSKSKIQKIVEGLSNGNNINELVQDLPKVLNELEKEVRNVISDVVNNWSDVSNKLGQSLEKIYSKVVNKWCEKLDKLGQRLEKIYSEVEKEVRNVISNVGAV